MTYAMPEEVRSIRASDTSGDRGATTEVSDQPAEVRVLGEECDRDVDDLVSLSSSGSGVSPTARRAAISSVPRRVSVAR